MSQLNSPVESEWPTTDALDEMLDEYAEHLERGRGLVEETIKCSCSAARRLVDECLGDGDLHWESLHARDVTAFLLHYAGRVKASSAKTMAGHLRRFLRYLLMRGKISVDLACAVPSVADRGSKGNLPSTLESEQIDHLLASCERASAIGQRDYAILLLLARLGLRAGEVVAMELSDVDWRAGVLTVRGKGPRWSRMPLPQDVGQALVTYLVEARPVCASRRVFVRWRPSVDGLSSSQAIRDVVHRALRRAGLKSERGGAHLLRHSLATEMLRKGLRLAEIGQVLRHRSSASTEVYARVDLTALQELAQPWPGGEL